METRISTYDEHGVTIRGKSLVDDIIGEMTFTQMIYLQILGKVPTPSQVRVLDAVLVTLVDHGLSAALGARLVYMASPDALQGAIATGILSMGSQFGGVMEEIGRNLLRIKDAADPDAEAAAVVAGYRAAKATVPGFGHPHHKPEDPRTIKLLQVAEQEGLCGAHVDALRRLARAVDASLGKHITINATAGIAALLGELGVPWRVMRGFAAISRTPGIVGQLLEEQSRPVAFKLAMMAHEAVPYAGEVPPRKGS